jgi:hypothetical protein
MELKRVETYSSFDISINHWITRRITPLASFKDEHFKVYHLIADTNDAYAIISIDEKDKFFFGIFYEQTINVEILRVLKELPLNPLDAKPITNIEKIDDLYNE